MKVSIPWLKELVDLKVSTEELIKLLPLRTIGLKEVTPEYIELDMKGYNRADLLSLRGIAYEAAAITNSQIKFQEEENYLWEKITLPKTNAVVENNILAQVYCIAEIQNLKVEQSDNAWVKKLRNSGIRSINNVADITNLIMVEYGQPMHAFDKDKVRGSIKVRVAKKDEKITTLDERTRDLIESDLLITDDNQPIGIAGIMGGKDSEISDQTTSILLEAAIFDPKTLRKTAKRLGLNSEASKRFYHGLTKKRLFQSLDAAIKMYEGSGGKLTALTIIDNLTQKVITLKLTEKKTSSLIGVKISPKQIEDYLISLGFKLASHIESGNMVWETTIPYFRLDIEIEEDLIEEVARMYGYEKIPAKPLSTNITKVTQNPLFGLLGGLKNTLSNLGLSEVQTYSYYSTQAINSLKLTIENLISVSNPLSSETEYLKNSLWPNLIEVVTKNIKNGFEDIAIFEIGKIYYIDQKKAPSEKYHLAIALMNNTDNPITELETLLTKLELGIKQKETKPYPNHFHPHRFLELIYQGKPIGFLTEVHKRITDKFGISQRVAVLEISITDLL